MSTSLTFQAVAQLAKSKGRILHRGIKSRWYYITYAGTDQIDTEQPTLAAMAQYLGFCK